MSNKTKNRGKKKSHNKQDLAVTLALSGKLMRMWEAIEQTKLVLDEQVETHGPNGPTHDRLLGKWATQMADFDDHVEKVHSRRQLRQVSAMVESNGHKMQHGSALRMLRQMGEALNGPIQTFSLPHAPSSPELHLKTIVFGVPLFGTREQAMETAANGEFVSLLRKSGWLPEQSNVVCLGALTSGDALTFAIQPHSMWRLIDFIENTRFSPNMLDDIPVKIPFFQRQNTAAKSESTPLYVGGHVLLMAAACQTNAADDVPLLPLEGATEEQAMAWQTCVADYDLTHTQAPGFGPPDILGVAAISAMALNIHSSLLIARTMENREQDTTQVAAIAFVIPDSNGPIDVIARFEDGTTVKTSPISAEIFLILDELAEALILPVDFIGVSEVDAWLNQPAEPLEHDNVIAFPVRSPKLH